MAIGALVARQGVAEKLVPGTHASTFGGNSLACAAAIAAFETVEEEHLLDHVNEISAYALGRLGDLKGQFDFIKSVRGRGVMIGMELTRSGQPIVQRCMDNGLLINCTHDTVLRFLPAMNVSREIMDEGLAILEQALSEEKT